MLEETTKQSMFDRREADARTCNLRDLSKCKKKNISNNRVSEKLWQVDHAIVKCCYVKK